MKSFYALYGRDQHVRAVKVTDYDGTVALSFVSTQMNHDVQKLVNLYGFVEVCRIVLAGGGSFTQEIEVPHSVAVEKIRTWRKSSEKSRFRLIGKRDIR